MTDTLEAMYRRLAEKAHKASQPEHTEVRRDQTRKRAVGKRGQQRYFSVQEIKDIRAKRILGDTLLELAEEYGVRVESISRIVRRVTYASVPD